MNGTVFIRVQNSSYSSNESILRNKLFGDPVYLTDQAFIGFNMRFKNARQVCGRRMLRRAYPLRCRLRDTGLPDKRCSGFPPMRVRGGVRKEERLSGKRRHR